MHMSTSKPRKTYFFDQQKGPLKGVSRGGSLPKGLREGLGCLVSHVFYSLHSQGSLRASPTVPLELKLPVELNSFSDASGVRK